MLPNRSDTGMAAAKPVREFDTFIDRPKPRSRLTGAKRVRDTDWLLDRSMPRYRGSGGEAHARGAWGESPQPSSFKRAEHTEGMRSE